MGGSLTVFNWRNKVFENILDGFWGERNSDDFYIPEVFNEGERGEEIFSSAEVKKLDILIRTGKVVFVEAPQEREVKIFCSRDKNSFILKEGSGGLQLRQDENWKRKNDQELLFTVQVPKDYRFSSVDLTSEHSRRHWPEEKSSGPMIEAQSLSAEELNIAAAVGVVKISGGSVGNLSAECNAGLVEFSGITTGDIKVSCNVGDIKLELAGKEEDYNYCIRSNLGAVTVGGDRSSAVGGMQMSHGAEKDMDLECNVGAVQVDFMDEL
jgi:hypothetical protein